VGEGAIFRNYRRMRRMGVICKVLITDYSVSSYFGGCKDSGGWEGEGGEEAKKRKRRKKIKNRNHGRERNVEKGRAKQIEITRE
jgi:hypothetical protein